MILLAGRNYSMGKGGLEHTTVPAHHHRAILMRRCKLSGESGLRITGKGWIACVSSSRVVPREVSFLMNREPTGRRNRKKTHGKPIGE